MKRGPRLACRLLPDVIGITAAPKPAVEWLEAISLTNGWYETPSDAREAGERWCQDFLAAVREELSELNRLGRFAPFAINSSSEYMLQGAAYVEPRDSEEVKQAKGRRARLYDYVAAFDGLTPREFEALCTGILGLFRIEEPKLTKSSNDEGIDFYGRLRMEKHLFPENIFHGVERQLLIWMLGQAKHYKKAKISTLEIRELVGAVELAKARAFGGPEGKYCNLQLRPCDPVYYLFFTTGVFSSNSWKLIDKSGVIGMDGEMLAAFLADQEVGLKNENFDYDTFRSWVRSFGIASI